jgi:hypothetical protein
MKTCMNPDCQQSNPQSLDNFYKCKKSKGGYRSRCRECLNTQHGTYSNRNQESNKRWRQANPDKVRLRRRIDRLKNKYGLSLQEYEDMLRSQGSQCKICGKNQSELDVTMAVDHCHKTNRIRGLLCDNCNKGLGHFRDDPAILEKAINYLIVREKVFKVF